MGAISLKVAWCGPFYLAPCGLPECPLDDALLIDDHRPTAYPLDRVRRGLLLGVHHRLRPRHETTHTKKVGPTGTKTTGGHVRIPVRGQGRLRDVIHVVVVVVVVGLRVSA